MAFSHQVLPALGLSTAYNEVAPDEIQRLEISDEMITACARSTPDTSNLRPIEVKYSDNLQPPVIQYAN